MKQWPESSWLSCYGFANKNCTFRPLIEDLIGGNLRLYIRNTWLKFENDPTARSPGIFVSLWVVFSKTGIWLSVCFDGGGYGVEMYVNGKDYGIKGYLYSLKLMDLRPIFPFWSMININ